MGCLISIFDLKSKTYDAKNVKSESMINLDNGFNYYEYPDYSPPRYNSLCSWD